MEAATGIQRLDFIYTAAEVALTFSVLPETVVMWIRLGKIEGRKVGHQWLIPAEEITRLQAERNYR